MALGGNDSYECLQPYFHCDQEEEPVAPQFQAAVPSEDIWKKFQLLPMAPPLPALGYNQKIPCEAQSSQASPKPILHQDCMWSGVSTPAAQKVLASRKDPAALQTPGSSRPQDSNPSIDPPATVPEAPKRSAKQRWEAPPSNGGRCTDSGSEEEEKEEGEERAVGRAPKRQAGKRCSPQLFVLKSHHILTKQHNYAACPPGGDKQAATRPKLHVQPGR